MRQGNSVSHRGAPRSARESAAPPRSRTRGTAIPSAGAHRAAAPRPDPAVARWIERTLHDDPPRARSLIVTVWGDALAPHGGEVWLAGLIRLLAPFGINERLTRTSVFRLA